MTIIENLYVEMT